MKRIFFGAWLCLLHMNSAFADAFRPDDHAPIGVMADHQHKKGEWMMSYRYMGMTMDGNRDGSDRLSRSEVLLNGTGDYRVAPAEMDMEMHMLGVMYAPSDKYTLMLMVPYLSSEMDHVTAMGGEFSTEASDLGDVSLSVISTNSLGFIWHLGVSIPTGNQDQKDVTPMGRSVLPYPMQIGSGTYDLIAGIGKVIHRNSGSSGVQLRGHFRLGENDDDYTVGNQYQATAWYSHCVSHSVSVSVRGLYHFQDDYSGSDPRYNMALNMNLVPTVDPDLRGGERLYLAVGLNWLLPDGHRLALEYQRPVWQKLNGPQLETDSVMTMGWQYAF